MPKRFVGSEELADVASQFYDIANRVQTAVKSMLEAKLEATHINSYAPIISDGAIELPAKVEAEISRRYTNSRQDLRTVVFVAQWTEWRHVV